MAQTIAAANSPHIEHGILVDLKMPVGVEATSTTGNGVTTTITFQQLTLAPFSIGDVITVSGYGSALLDGTRTVTGSSTTQVQFSSTYSGSNTTAAVAFMNKEYYLTNCYTNLSYLGRSYRAQGGLLDVEDIQADLQSTNNEINVGLSAIPSNLIETVLGQQIKGSEIKIYRAFFDSATQRILVEDAVTQVFMRFNGVVTNYAIQEQISGSAPDVDISYTITLTCSNVFGVLENRVSGRRTNSKSYNVAYAGERFITSGITTDPSMSRVETLRNASFDFGKPK
jgi:hypothetical protein